MLAWVRELADAGSGPALIRRGPIFRAYPVDAQTHNCLRTGKKLRGHRALALTFSRSVAYGLDIMAIRVEHKSTVIVTMIIWSRPWSAVVAPTSGKCSRMKGIYRRTVWCREGHVRASDHRIARADPEDRLLVRAVSQKNLPLRAATSLARLLYNQGRPADSITCLQPVYDRFTEGFATADLIIAKQVLNELSHAPAATHT